MTVDETSRKLAARILDWYEAMGVDAALDEAPADWLARGDRAPGAGFALDSAQVKDVPPASTSDTGQIAQQNRSPKRAKPQRQFPATPAPATDANARGAVNRAGTLAELEGMLQRFDGCGLKATAKNLCFYRGAEKARLMIIGEAPGRDEDLEGKPFVGRAGMLLDKMLAAIDLGESDVHITNIVYWRPPGNRTPTPQEALACRPFLERQVALVAPEIILALGGAAAKQMFDVTDGIMRLRGRWRTLKVGGYAVRAIATLHPAYLLRTPAAKGMAWRDLLAIKSALNAGH
ncbi:MAG: uracil-DNA glycosylase [Hyphomicrobium sp.]